MTTPKICRFKALAATLQRLRFEVAAVATLLHHQAKRSGRLSMKGISKVMEGAA